MCAGARLVLLFGRGSWGNHPTLLPSCTRSLPHNTLHPHYPYAHASQVENQAALQLLQRFVHNGREMDGQPTRDRLKLIPRIVNADEWAQKGPLSGGWVGCLGWVIGGHRRGTHRGGVTQGSHR